MILHLLKLMRWPNLLMVAFTQLSVAIALGGWQIQRLQELILTVISTLFITSGGYIINDYLDLKIDRINKPDDMVIGKYISRKKSIIIHIALNVLALIGGLGVSPVLFGIELTTIFLLIKYSSSFKKQFLLGNVIIALLCGALFPIMLCWNPNLPLEPLIAFGIFAFWLTIIREIVKDLEDLKGDRMKQCKTLAIVFGPVKTKKILQWLGFVQLAMIVSFALRLFVSNYFLFPAYLLLFAGIPVIYIIFAAGNLYTTEDYKIMSRRIKFTMLAGIAAIWFYLI